jgi:hypothetical protein
MLRQREAPRGTTAVYYNEGSMLPSAPAAPRPPPPSHWNVLAAQGIKGQRLNGKVVNAAANAAAAAPVVDPVLVLLSALETVSKVSELPIRLDCLKSLDLIIGNIVKSPNEPKYRRLKLDSAGFKPITGCTGGLEVVHALGFKEDGNGYAILPAEAVIPAEFVSTLSSLKNTAQSEKEALELASATLRAQAEAAAAAAEAERQRAVNAKKANNAQKAADLAKQVLADRAAKLKAEAAAAAQALQARQAAELAAAAEKAAAEAATREAAAAAALAAENEARAELERQRLLAVEAAEAQLKREKANANARTKAEEAEVARLAEERAAAERAAQKELDDAEQERINAKRLEAAKTVGSNALWAAGKLAQGLGTAGYYAAKGTAAAAYYGVKYGSKGIYHVAKFALAPGDGGDEPPPGSTTANNNNRAARPRANATRRLPPPNNAAVVAGPSIRAKNGPSVRRMMNAEHKTREQIKRNHPEMRGFFKGNVSRPNVLGGAYTKKSKKGSKNYSRKN